MSVTSADVYATTYKPGDKVERSGIYLVVHDPAHTKAHEVTVVHGKVFPPCGSCKHPRFKAVKLAQHIGSNEHFS